MANYIASSKIKVFPTSYRDHSIDPESYLNTEKNLTSLKIIDDSYQNFVDQNGDKLTIYLKGYSFQVSKQDILDDLGLGNVDIYAGIKLVTDNIVWNSNPNNNTFASKRLDNIESTGSKLDSLDNSLTSTFQGLKFGDLNTFVGQGFDAFIKVLEHSYSSESDTHSWSVPNSSRIRISANEVSSGSDDDMSINQRLWTGEIHFAAGANGTLDGISDTPANSSTTAASVKAVKTVFDQKLDANGFSTSNNVLSCSAGDFTIQNNANDIVLSTNAGGNITLDTTSGADDGTIHLIAPNVYLSTGGTYTTNITPSTTSSPSITLPSISGKLALEGDIASNWSTGIAYYIGDYVYYGSTLYRCKTKHISGLTFDSTKFDLIKISQTKLDKIISCTYSDLNELRIGGHLVPGQYYLVNDYTLMLPDSHMKKNWNESVWDHTTITNPKTTKYFEVDYSSDGVVFGLLLKALSTSTFSDDAMTVSTDAYISGWNVKYRFTNDTSIFNWANSGGKGVIYYMEDKRGNVAPYDMINLKMTFKERNSSSDSWTTTLSDMYTFNVKYQTQSSVAHKNLVTWDVVDSTHFIFWGNKIKPSLLSSGSSYELPSVVFTKETSSTTPPTKYWTNNTVGLNARHIVFKDTRYTSVCENNVIEDDCSLVLVDGIAQNNLVRGSYIQVSGRDNEIINSNCVIVTGSDNKIKSGCERILIVENGFHNKIGSNCSVIKIDEYGNYNEIGDCHTNVVMGIQCSYNKLGIGINDVFATTNISMDEGCESNIIGDGCSDISMGTGCTNNKIGEKCTNITIGDGCSDNEIGNYCDLVHLMNHNLWNKIGDCCRVSEVANWNINLGSDASYNTLGTNCSTIDIENSSEYNTIGANCHDISILNNSAQLPPKDNIIGDDCSDISFSGVQNVFGQHCSDISLGTYAVSNTFGSDCSQIKALNYFNNNTFYNGCNNFQLSNCYQNNVFMNGVNHFGVLDYDVPEAVSYSSYVKNYIVEAGVSYVTPGTLSGTGYLQNVYVCGGINGTSSSYKSVRPTARGLSYQTIFKNPNSTVVPVS